MGLGLVGGNGTGDADSEGWPAGGSRLECEATWGKPGPRGAGVRAFRNLSIWEKEQIWEADRGRWPRDQGNLVQPPFSFLWLVLPHLGAPWAPCTALRLTQACSPAPCPELPALRLVSSSTTSQLQSTVFTSHRPHDFPSLLASRNRASVSSLCFLIVYPDLCSEELVLWAVCSLIFN